MPDDLKEYQVTVMLFMSATNEREAAQVTRQKLNELPDDFNVSVEDVTVEALPE